MIKKTFHHLITARRKELPFIVLFAFISTFLLARFVVYLIFNEILTPTLFNYVSLRGEVIHIHHLSYGIVLMSIISFLSIALPHIYQKRPHTFSYLYGLSLGLIVDEFALWLQLEDNYYDRLSYDAFITVSAILLLTVYFPEFWKWVHTRVLKKGWKEIK
jgi:hypothetical protein